MKELRKEIEKAKQKKDEAFKEYMKKPTKQNYDWHQYCAQYYNGLKKAFELIEGE